MRFRLTRHARARQREYGILDAWITRVLDHPARRDAYPEDPALTIASSPIAEKDGRVLRVVYNHQQPEPVVVTLFFDRRLRGKL